MHNAFGELKHVNPDYLVSNRRGRVRTNATGYGSASTVPVLSSSFETTSNDEDTDSSSLAQFRVPKSKGRGNYIIFINSKIKLHIQNN